MLVALPLPNLALLQAGRHRRHHHASHAEQVLAAGRVVEQAQAQLAVRVRRDLRKQMHVGG